MLSGYRVDNIFHNLLHTYDEGSHIHRSDFDENFGKPIGSDGQSASSPERCAYMYVIRTMKPCPLDINMSHRPGLHKRMKEKYTNIVIRISRFACMS